MFPRTCPSCGQLGLGCIIGGNCSNCGARETHPDRIRRPMPRPEEERPVEPPDNPRPVGGFQTQEDVDPDPFNEGPEDWGY